ncbi:hypothetical protein [Yinghuangia seranimata]|uniref:hypothetical protein n=1 Tax=Yinghuangia seranimata TaxID=408067 RepID=UPI00248CFD99|nr:hypothetical protein [Yinghuangia seranimata]MDI2132311.1 hypothetical protein [Yinghuangia seranimata]
MAKQKAKPHMQSKSPMFADAARAAHGDEERAHEGATLVSERDNAQQQRPAAKGRKQSRGQQNGPRGRGRQ